MVKSFIEIMIDVNLRAAVVICIVLLLRLLFSKLQISKKYANLLWLLPYLCLLMPWRLESSFSFWGGLSGFENVMEQSDQYSGNTPITVPVPVSKENDNAIEGKETVVAIDGEYDTENTGQTGMANMIQSNRGGEQFIENMLFIIWFLGLSMTILYGIISYVRLRKKVLCSICVQDNIYYTDDIAVPFVLGIIHPRIYLPSGRKQDNLQYVLEHEKTHILCRDSLKKEAAFLITGVHWFNPLVWIAFYFLGKDIEMACDEETIQRIGLDKKQDYAETLLRMTSGKRAFPGMAVPLAFGEGDVKGRIQNILNYKRTARIAADAAVVMIGFLCAVFLTDPKRLDEFAMKDLIVLCNEGRAAFKKTWDDLIATEGAAYKNFKHSDEKESLTADYSCSLVYNDKEYELQVYYWKKETAKEYGYEPYELDTVILCEKASGATQMLYSCEPEQYTENRDIQSFLGQEYDITQYLSVDLPEGVTMGSFRKGINDLWDGCIFEGDFEEPAHGEGCPESWYAPGGVGVLELDVPAGESDRALFENDRLQEIVWLLNYADWTDYEVLEGCQM